MAGITKEAVQKINSRCKNGWRFDVRYWAYHKEKTLGKMIKLSDTHYLECNLSFTESYRNYDKELKITLHISEFSRTGNGMATSYGLGLFRDIDYGKVRKQFSDLEKLTEIFNDDLLMEIYNNPDNKNKLRDGIVLDKSGWHLHEF